MYVVTPTEIPEVLILEPQVFGDRRGYFMESYNRREFEKAVGRRVDFVMDDQSMSRQNVLRGLNYQVQQPQAKLIRCIQGRIADVAVDLRKSSPTFGKWVMVELTAKNKRNLWIPEGFAHGFLALSEFAQVFYKSTEYYINEYRRAIIWNDPDLNIAWPQIEGEPVISAKDALAKSLRKAQVFD